MKRLTSNLLTACLASMTLAAIGDAKTLAAIGDANTTYIASSTLRLTLDGRGRLQRLVTSTGVELLNGDAPAEAFMLGATRIDDYTVSKYVNAHEAKKIAIEKEDNGVKVVFSKFATNSPVERVICHIRGMADDKRLRFGIETEMRDGWALTSAQYPNLKIVSKIGEKAEDDAFASGHVNNRLLENPFLRKAPTTFYGGFPGSMATQFVTFYDDRAGLLIAAEDSLGLTKTFTYHRGPKGFDFFISSKSFDLGVARRPYEVTLVGFSGTDDNPCTWQDAADIYREWASQQKWCSTSIADRKDLPAWMKDAPAMTMFKPDWFKRPEMIHRWINEYWTKKFPGTPLLASMWGWEGRGEWVGTDYFPCYPSDAEFVAITKDMREHGIHPYPWPSGYYWTLTYDKRADGSFAFDDRERFARIGAGHVVCNRDGEQLVRKMSWLKGGEAVELCGGDPWTIPWVSENIVRELAKRGCDVIHGDQLNGGAFADCWSRKHPHAPGTGPWKVAAMRAQLVAAREAIVREMPEGGVVSYEEPNETLDDLSGIQLTRCNSKLANQGKANLYAYVNHGAIPIYFANPPRGDYDWMAYALTEGQMPRFVPHLSDLGGLVLPPDFFASAREVTTTGTNKFHYGENAIGSDHVFRPGRKYRLSADFETLKCAKGARLHLDCGIYTAKLKSLGGGHIPFPVPGDGVRRLSCELVMKDGMASIFRVMLNSRGDAHGKVSNLKLEIVEPDGSVRTAYYEGDPRYDNFMRRWLSLYRDEAREFLMNGRHVKSPHVTCEKQDTTDCAPGHPAVYVSAFTTWDGSRKSVFLANATTREQRITWLDGSHRSLVLSPLEVKMIPE